MPDADTPSQTPAFFTGPVDRDDATPSTTVGASAIRTPGADFTVAPPPGTVTASLRTRSDSAYDAIDRQLGKAADLLDTAAELIDDRFGAATPDTADEPAPSRRVSRTMRTFATQVRAQDSRELADRARTAAARHPVYTFGIGAALGAIALGIFARSGGKGRA